jgi:hypothetical protein
MEKKMCYGDYSNKSDKWLEKRSSKIYDIMFDNIHSKYIKLIEELMECDRELTLREDR